MPCTALARGCPIAHARSRLRAKCFLCTSTRFQPLATRSPPSRAHEVGRGCDAGRCLDGKVDTGWEGNTPQPSIAHKRAVRVSAVRRSLVSHANVIYPFLYALFRTNDHAVTRQSITRGPTSDHTAMQFFVALAAMAVTVDLTSAQSKDPHPAHSLIFFHTLARAAMSCSWPHTSACRHSHLRVFVSHTRHAPLPLVPTSTPAVPPRLGCIFVSHSSALFNFRTPCPHSPAVTQCFPVLP